MMEDDGDFSEDEEVSIMAIFAKDLSIARVYSASRKQSRRTAFMRRLLDQQAQKSNENDF